MRLPLEWLGEYVDTGLSPEEIADRLKASGTEVDAIRRVGPRPDEGDLESFRVGKVLSVERHPDADKLSVCAVDLGEGAPRQIVCGAPNVAAGQSVGVALPGAVLPGREPLGKARLRGVESDGMILSETELELGSDAAGIMVLPGDPAPGSPLAGAVPISDAVLEIELTSNRPDCESVYGLAREVHAVTEAPLAPLDDADPPAEGPGTVADHARLRVEDPDLCPRYMARVLTDVTVGPSPLWLRRRLEAAGMRAISNVVDVTNYVMLLTGQPLHAFDLDRVSGAEIVVRRATPGEPITTLDGQRRELEPWMLAICDAERPAVIAGIMGAEDVEVHAGTSRVLLEAATFDGPTTMRASLALGLRSESSGRFEKGLPAALPPRALAIASRMLVELCGARLVPGTLDVAEEIVPARPIRLRHARQTQVLGAEIPAAEAAGILRRLDFDVREDGEDLDATPPFERAADVTREVDLIEEVVRVAGHDRIPPELPRFVANGRRTPAQALRARMEDRAVDLGLFQVVSYRFVPPEDVDLLRLAPEDARRQVVRIANPVSEEMAVMRRSLLPGLLRAVARNARHQRRDGGLFEVGRTYAPRPDGLADEPEQIAAVRFGADGPEGWRDRPRPVDVFTATGLAAGLAAAARVPTTARPGEEPYLHPVRQAVIEGPAGPLGIAGEVHPLVLRELGIEGPVAFCSLELGPLLAARPGPAVFEDLLTVPVSRRDVAVVVPEDVPAARLVEAAERAGAPLVRGVRVFDRYAGEQVGEGRVSLALRMEVVDPGRTLTDEEIDAAVAKVVAALAECGGELRA
jgi:phenylalanyl-tRNA synthetase beta chain